MTHIFIGKEILEYYHWVCKDDKYMVVNLEDTGQVSTCIVSYDKDISITYLVDRGVIGPRKAYQPRSGLAVYFGPGNVRICTYLNLPLFSQKTIEKRHPGILVFSSLSS